MAVSTKVSVAVHILTMIEYLEEEATSEFIAKSVNTNPVVIRRIMGQLKKAGLIESHAGTRKNRLAKPVGDITLYDIYLSVEGNKEIFSIHNNPRPDCVVGGNIQDVLENKFLLAQQRMEAELKKISLAEVITDLEAHQKIKDK